MGWLLEWGPHEIWALRTVRRDSHQSLGEHLGASEQTVRRWEKSGQPPTHKELLRKLDETLAALEPWRREWFDQLRTQTPAPTVDAANGSTSQEDAADRRQASKALVRLAAGLAAAAFPLGAVDRITHHGDRPVDSKLLTAHEDLADELVGLHHARPDLLVGLVAHHADMLLELLDRDSPQPQRRRLEATAVGACAQTGMLAFEAGYRATARRYFALGRQVADDSGDDTLTAQALGIASVLHSPLPSGGLRGDRGRSVELLQRAATHARGADHDTRAWVHRWLAPELAAAGDERGFFESIEAAERLATRVGHQDGRGFFTRDFATTSQALSDSIGLGLVLLRRAEAVEVLTEALDVPDPRWRIKILVDIGSARMIHDDPEGTCHALIGALDGVAAAGNVTAIERVRGVRARFPANWAPLPCVQDLDERLRLTTP